MKSKKYVLQKLNNFESLDRLDFSHSMQSTLFSQKNDATINSKRTLIRINQFMNDMRVKVRKASKEKINQAEKFIRRANHVSKMLTRGMKSKDVFIKIKNTFDKQPNALTFVEKVEIEDATPRTNALNLKFLKQAMVEKIKSSGYISSSHISSMPEIKGKINVDYSKFRDKNVSQLIYRKK